MCQNVKINIKVKLFQNKNDLKNFACKKKIHADCSNGTMYVIEGVTVFISFTFAPCICTGCGSLFVSPIDSYKCKFVFKTYIIYWGMGPGNFSKTVS